MGLVATGDVDAEVSHQNSGESFFSETTFTIFLF
jgi:hypothetical protein